MKTIFSSILLLAVLQTQAQQSDYGTVLKKENDTYVSSHINNVNAQAVRNMVTNYENAENVKWTVDESGTTAAFSEGKKKVKLNYDKLGNLVTTRITYAGEYLEPYIAKYAKKIAGKDFAVDQVTEISRGEKIMYEISLKNRFKICIITLIADKQKGIERTDNIRIFSKAT